MVPEPLTYWVNIYGGGFRGLTHTTRDDAIRTGRRGKHVKEAYRVAYRVKVTFKEKDHERPGSFEMPREAYRYSYADHKDQERRFIEQWKRTQRLETSPIQGAR